MKAFSIAALPFLAAAAAAAAAADVLLDTAQNGTALGSSPLSVPRLGKSVSVVFAGPASSSTTTFVTGFSVWLMSNNDIPISTCSLLGSVYEYSASTGCGTTAIREGLSCAFTGTFPVTATGNRADFAVSMNTFPGASYCFRLSETLDAMEGGGQLAWLPASSRATVTGAWLAQNDAGLTSVLEEPTGTFTPYAPSVDVPSRAFQVTGRDPASIVATPTPSTPTPSAGPASASPTPSTTVMPVVNVLDNSGNRGSVGTNSTRIAWGTNAEYAQYFKTGAAPVKLTDIYIPLLVSASAASGDVNVALSLSIYDMKDGKPYLWVDASRTTLTASVFAGEGVTWARAFYGGAGPELAPNTMYALTLQEPSRAGGKAEWVHAASPASWTGTAASANDASTTTFLVMAGGVYDIRAETLVAFQLMGKQLPASPVPSSVPSPTPNLGVSPAVTPAVTPAFTPAVTPAVTPVVTPAVTPVVTPAVTATTAATSAPVSSSTPTPSSSAAAPEVLLDNTLQLSSVSTDSTVIAWGTNAEYAQYFMTGSSAVQLTKIFVPVRLPASASGIKNPTVAMLSVSIYDMKDGKPYLWVDRSSTTLTGFVTPGGEVPGYISVEYGNGPVLAPNTMYALTLKEVSRTGGTTEWMSANLPAEWTGRFASANDAGTTKFIAMAGGVYTDYPNVVKAFQLVGKVVVLPTASPSALPPGASASPTTSATPSVTPSPSVVPVANEVAVAVTLPGTDPVALATNPDAICGLRESLATVAGVPVSDVDVSKVVNLETGEAAEIPPVPEGAADPCVPVDTPPARRLAHTGALRISRRLAGGLTVEVKINVTQSTLLSSGGNAGQGAVFAGVLESAVSAAVAQTFSDPARLDALLATVVQAACSAAGLATCPAPSEVVQVRALTYAPPEAPAAAAEKDNTGLIVGLVVGLGGGLLLLGGAYYVFVVKAKAAADVPASLKNSTSAKFVVREPAAQAPADGGRADFTPVPASASAAV